MTDTESLGQLDARELDRGNDIWYILWVLQKRLWLLVAVFVVGMTGTLFYVSTLKPVYKATAQLLVTTAKPGSVADDDYTGATYFQTEMIMETQRELLKNLALAEEVVTQLGLDKKDSEIASQDPTGFQRFYRFVRRIIWTTKREAATPEQPRVTREAQALLNNLEVERVKGSRIINVSYKSPSPQIAAAVANALVKTHMEQEKGRRFKVTKEKLDWLQEQAEIRRAALKRAEQELNEYQKKLQDVSLEEKRNITAEKLNNLNKAVHEAETARIQAETALNELHAHLKAGRAIESFSRTNPLANDEFATVKATLVNLKGEEIALGKKYGPKHPQMIKLREQIAAIEKQLEQAAKTMAARIESEYQLAKAREEELKRALEAQKKAIFDLNDRAIEYNSKKLEVETNKRLLEQLLSEISQTGLASTIKESSLHIIAEARVPTEPSGPKRFYALALGTLFSIITGCMLALLMEYVDTSVKTGDEIERFVKVPFLGLIDKYEGDGADSTKGSAYLVTINAPKSNTSENFRKIRTNIIFSSHEANPRTLLVTSPVPREGKTLVTINLAIVMAQSGKRILLVDADLRRPMIHKAVGLDNSSGLSTYLAGLSGLEEIIKPCLVDNLWVVTSGPIPPNQSELLGSEPMRTFLMETVKRFDMVIIDCAPVTSVADALVLGSMVDGVVQVVKSHSTARGLLEQSTQHLRDVNAKVIGVILNQVDFRKTGYAYGKYYSYRYYGYYDYSYYASDEEPTLEERQRRHTSISRSSSKSGKEKGNKT